jgi:hypothetical protein
MSSFLKDKEWENMDWLNKAVEPYTFSLNTELAKIPSSYSLSYRDVIGLAGSSLRSLTISQVVNSLVYKLELPTSILNTMDMVGYNKLFEFKVEPDSVIDIDQEIILGEVTLLKKIESLDDEMIRNMLPDLVLHFMRISSNVAKSNYINEVMDILDYKEARSYSIKKKLSYFRQYMLHVYADNKWNIRNVDLAIKMLEWIKSYCENGDRCSLANLSKLKCMTHNGHPIYSMEEIK